MYKCMAKLWTNYSVCTYVQVLSRGVKEHMPTAGLKFLLSHVQFFNLASAIIPD